MNNRSRILSILKAASLDYAVTGFPSFALSKLALDRGTDFDFQLPTNLRLGHLAEKVVAQLIKASSNYEMLYENIQLVKDKKTIGELDFIISNKDTKQLLHIELAYKFYLFDPSLSAVVLENWIGPNRNDSLKEKLDKLRNKQFPLLYHPATKSRLDRVVIENITQQLCLLVTLFIPYQYHHKFPSDYQQAIKGYYLNLETFTNFDHSEKTYYLPPKTAWGISPSENKNWHKFQLVKTEINESLAEKQAVLCWQKHHDSYLSFFIVWW